MYYITWKWYILSSIFLVNYSWNESLTKIWNGGRRSSEAVKISKNGLRKVRGWFSEWVSSKKESVEGLGWYGTFLGSWSTVHLGKNKIDPKSVKQQNQKNMRRSTRHICKCELKCIEISLRNVNIRKVRRFFEILIGCYCKGHEAFIPDAVTCWDN